MSSGVKSTGSFDPEEVMCYIEENCTMQELRLFGDFLSWVHRNNMSFGHGNYEEVVESYFRSLDVEKLLDNL